MMKKDVKYAVFIDRKEDAIGYFFDCRYYEPFNSDSQVGYLDENDNFIYLIVTPENPNLRIHGKIVDNKLIRMRDDYQFQIQPI